MDEPKKEYHKYKDYSFYILVIILVVAWFSARNVFIDVGQYFGSLVWLFAIGIILFCYVLNSIVYEIGKMMFGRFSGYHLIYTNLFGFTWTKDSQNKSRFKIKSWENFGCKTLMAGKNNDGSGSHPVMYLLGGSIFIALLDTIIIVCGVLLEKKFDEPIYSCCGYVQGILGLIILILNLSPFLSDSVLDGFQLRLVLLNKDQALQYHQNLYQLEALITGKHPLEHFEYEDYHNLFATESLIYLYYAYIHDKDYKNAEECALKIIEYKEYAFEEVLIRAYSYKFYFQLLRGEEEKTSDEYWALSKTIRKGCNSSSDYEGMKTALLIASLIDLNYDLYEYITTKIDKKMNHYQYTYRIDDEEELIQKSLDYIEVKKTEWFKPYTSEEENEK